MGELLRQAYGSSLVGGSAILLEFGGHVPTGPRIGPTSRQFPNQVTSSYVDEHNLFVDPFNIRNYHGHSLWPDSSCRL